MRRLSGRRGGLGRGERGWAKEAPPAAGLEPGLLDSRGWRRALTLRSHIHPRPMPPLHPPPGPLPQWCASSGAGKGPGSSAREMPEWLGDALTHEPRKSRYFLSLKSGGVDEGIAPAQRIPNAYREA